MKKAGSNDDEWVDLHIHSTASDGTLSPEQILKMARDLDLRAISITDHDTINGSIEAHRHLTPQDVELLSGVEISTSLQGNTLHILGYLIDLQDPALSRTLSILQNARKERNPKIIQKLQQLGIELTYEEVAEVAGGGEVGRPHIAEVLLQKKVVGSINEAFQKYLGTNGPAYVDKYRLQPAEAISSIADAGGIPVLAHPFTIKSNSERDLDKIVSELVSNGLKGIEVYYSEHTDIQTVLYERIAQKHSLLITGGTDFHGARKAGVHMGVGKGNLRIPYRLVEALKEYKVAHSTLVE
jgi:predicted metal-dependent phosphoesterase TrpH